MRALLSILAYLALALSSPAHPSHRHAHPSKESALPLHQIIIEGDTPQDKKIRKLQSRLSQKPQDAPIIEQLGWLFVAKARSEIRAGFFQHARRCAKALVADKSARHQGLLLQGHLELQEHRFDEAKNVATQLVNERGWHFDHGLLGDVLYDLGDSEGAIRSYEAMMAQRPGLESFARASMIRWLRGNVVSAIEAMEMAVSAGSLRQPEPLAWAYSKLAAYHLQQAEFNKVDLVCRTALKLVPAFPHAQLVQGRALMAQGFYQEALPILKGAADTLPEPSFLWALRDCYEQLGDAHEMTHVETKLYQTGQEQDPRTYALFLATKGVNALQALTLAEEELTLRQDIFSHDALAWALWANGKKTAAVAAMAQALAEGTHDGRLSLHAAIITGDEKHLTRARKYQSLLLPSELSLLNKLSSVSNPQS